MISPIKNQTEHVIDVPHTPYVMQMEKVHARLAATVQESLSEIYLVDAQSLHFRFASIGMQRNLGCDMPSLLTVTLLDVQPELDERKFRELIGPLLTGEKDVVDFEGRHMRSDGTRYPVDVRLQLFPRPDGAEILGIAFDITERRRKEAKLNTIVDTIPQLAWIAETDGCRSWYNQRWYDYTGLTQAEAAGWGWQRTHDPELLPEVMEHWCKCTATEKAFDMEIPLRGADGYYRIFLTRAEPLRDAEGRVVQWFGTNTDVNEQRLAEKSRRETERQLQVVMENMSEGLVISDFSLKLLNWNPAALKMHDLDCLEEVTGNLASLSRLYELSTVEGSVLPLPQWPLPRLLRGEKFHDLELRIRRLDRNWTRVFSYSGALLQYGEGQGLIFLVIRDITERKYAEEALLDAKINLEYKVNERTAQLLAKSREMENFCYSVSHDLRAPLRGIAGYSRLLMESHYDRLDEEGRGFVKNVHQAAQQMTELIEDLLSYSKLERRKLSTTLIKLSTFVPELLGQFQDDIAHVRLTVYVDDVQLSADPDGLAIALRNLIDNALKFSRYATDPAIEIRAWATDENCFFSVRDNGIGFDMRFYDKIFEIFQRLHRAEEYPGTGIGLAMVQKAIDRMGGRVWAESQLGAGAVFYFQLPLAGLTTQPFHSLPAN